MTWFHELFFGDSIAHSVLILSLVAFLGLALGSLRIRGIGLGVAGVLFSGLIFGHFHVSINHEILELG